MAAIDKIYGTQAEWDELRAWLRQHRPTYVRYLYPRPLVSQGQFALSNFGEKADQWLFLHCPIRWVHERIAEQYAVDFKQARYAEQKAQ